MKSGAGALHFARAVRESFKSIFGFQNRSTSNRCFVEEDIEPKQHWGVFLSAVRLSDQRFFSFSF
jgi:hypothetical protein